MRDLGLDRRGGPSLRARDSDAEAQPFPDTHRSPAVEQEIGPERLRRPHDTDFSVEVKVPDIGPRRRLRLDADIGAQDKLALSRGLG